jgi:pimeloyl-ACP methyl ester carboxylesterase
MRPAAIFAILACALPALAQQPQPAPTPPAPPGPASAEAAPKTTPLAHVEARGTGPVNLVLIPGLWQDWHEFDSFMTRNAAKYTMYAVTLPGFGGSEPPPLAETDTPADPRWLDNAERAVAAMIAEKMLEKVMLVGEIMGGQVAIRVAARHPGLVEKLLVINSMPAYPIVVDDTVPVEFRREEINTRLAPRYKALDDEGWAKEVRTYITSTTETPGAGGPLADAALKVPRPTATRYWLEYIASDITPEARALALPTLVIASVPQIEGVDKEALAQRWLSYYDGVRAAVVFFQDVREMVTIDAPDDLDRAVAEFAAGGAVHGKGPRQPAAPAEPLPPAPTPGPANGGAPVPPAPSPAAPGTPPK